MKHLVGVDGIARKVLKNYIGVDGIARNVLKGYVGVEGVARQYFSNGVKWEKWSGYRRLTDFSEPTSYSGTYTLSSGSVSESYTFSTSNGFYMIEPYYSYNRNMDTEYLNSLKGFYSTHTAQIDGATYSVVRKFLGFDDLSASNPFRFQNVSKARGEHRYYKGSVYYGEVVAEEGQLPGDGFVVGGSVYSSICVLSYNSSYYYYKRV